MLSALGDPYTAYLGPVDYRLLRQETASHYSGIGVSVLPSPKGLVVVSLRPGPAEQAGVRSGDTIVRIGATPTLRLGMSAAFARILGPPGTHVRLELMRGGRRLDLNIRRALVRAPVVDAKLLSYAGRRWGVLDVPSERKIHTESIPRIGGVSVTLAAVLSLAVVTALGWASVADVAGWAPALLGVIIVFGVGLRDDLKPVRPVVKLVFQVLAAIVAGASPWACASITSRCSAPRTRSAGSACR